MVIIKLCIYCKCADGDGTSDSKVNREPAFGASRRLADGYRKINIFPSPLSFAAELAFL